MTTSPLYRTTWPSPIGPLLLIASDEALCGVWFCDQKGIPTWAQTSSATDHHRWLDITIGQLQAYFDGHRQDFDLPLDISRGTTFQQDVWRALQDIPWGHTVTYQHVAGSVGRPQAVRAVGGAVGHNPLGIVLPCHRVVGSDGQLTGYTGGLERKVALLQLEGALF